MKYYLYWDSQEESNWNTRSLLEIFLEVYGVEDFTIKCKKFTIKGLHYFQFDNYDFGFRFMLSCFLTPRQITKFYKELLKNE